MQIKLTFDPSAASAPAGFEAAIIYAASIFDAAFTNNVTINIDVGWNEINGDAVTDSNSPDRISASEFAQAPKFTYSAIQSALIANANSPVQQAADATLPAVDPSGGDTFDVGRPEAKALGLLPANAGAVDGWIGFTNFDFINQSEPAGEKESWSFGTHTLPGPRQYDIVAEAEHEISEVLGRVSDLGTQGEWYAHAFGVLDLFRYSAPGVRELAPGPVHSTGYFSIDNGNTPLGNWNNHVATGDLADWGSGFGSGGGPGPNGNDAFNNESNPGVFNVLSESDLTVMNVLGWNPSAPANVVIDGETYFVMSGQTASDLIVETGGALVVGPDGISDVAMLAGGDGEIFSAGVANETAIAAGLTLTVDSGGTANGSVIAGGTLDLQDGASAGTAPIVFNGPGGTLEIDGATAPANVISGFAAGDSIDFSGANIGANPVLQLLPGNLLSMTEHNKTYDFQFDPNDDFTGQTFHAIGDGHSGTLIFIDPGVLSVATSGPDITAGSGDLNAGHQVTLTLNTNEPIDVDTSQGTPTLTLNDGGTATYTGGSGSDALNFQYTVASGENTPDLAVTAFNANGAAAGDANGHAAVFTDTVGNPAGTLQIDTTPPQLTGISMSPDGTLTLSFNEAVTVANGTPTLALNDGGSAVYDPVATAALHDPTRLAFDYPPAGSLLSGPPQLAVTSVTTVNASDALTDLASNVADMTADGSLVAAALHAPVVDASHDFHLI